MEVSPQGCSHLWGQRSALLVPGLTVCTQRKQGERELILGSIFPRTWLLDVLRMPGRCRANGHVPNCLLSPREPSGEVQVSRPTAQGLRCLFAGKSDLLSPSLADKGLSFLWRRGQGCSRQHHSPSWLNLTVQQEPGLSAATAPWWGDVY